MLRQLFGQVVYGLEALDWALTNWDTTMQASLDAEAAYVRQQEWEDHGYFEYLNPATYGYVGLALDNTVTAPWRWNKWGVTPPPYVTHMHYLHSGDANPTNCSYDDICF